MSSIKKELEKIQISTDLVQGALNQLEFLEEVNLVRNSLMREDILEKAVYRYEKLWLPFYSKFNDNKLTLFHRSASNLC